MSNCSLCGKKLGAFVKYRGHANELLCDVCHNNTIVVGQTAEEYAKVSAESAKEKENRERLRELAEQVMVTTTNNIDGYSVSEYLGIESVEIIPGTGVLSEFSTGILDFLAARSKGFESKLQKAKAEALSMLKFLAAEMGGNAIIGIDLDYAEFSGNRVAVIVNGTIVKVEKLT